MLEKSPQALVSLFRRLTGTSLSPRSKDLENPELVRPSYYNRHPEGLFLVLGNGPSLQQHQRDIYQFIDSYAPVVLGANNITEVIFPDYHAYTNRRRFMTFGHRINATKSKVLFSAYMPDWVIRQRYDGPYERIMYVNDHERPFDIQNGIIMASCRSVSLLVLGVALVMGASRIAVAGVDGYAALLQENRRLQYYPGDTDVGPDPTRKREFFLELEAYQVRFLDEISAYMKRQGMEPFRIFTPTQHVSHYESLEEFVKRL